MANISEKLQARGLIDRLSFLAKDVAVYGIANAFSKLLSVFLIPILISLLSKEEYGVVDGINMLIALFLPIVIFGQDSALARYYFELKDESERSNLISQSLILQATLAFFTILFINLCAGLISNLYFDSAQYIELIKVSTICIFFSFIVRYCSNLLKWQFRRIPFVIISIGMPFLSTIATILFLKYSDFGIMGVFYGQIVGNGIFAIIGIFCISNQIRVPKNFKWILPLLSFGWPYFLIMILPVILPSFDRYLIINSLDLNSLGLYALAFRIASIIQLPIYGFQTAWAPFAYSIYGTVEYQQTYSFTLKCYAAVLLGVGLLINIFLKEIIILFSNTEYLDARLLIVPILLGKIIESFSWITGIGIDISKKSYFSAFSYIISIAIGVGLAWFGIVNYGLLGLVLFGLLAKIIFTVLKSVFAHISLPINYDYIPLILFITIALLINLSIQYLVYDEIKGRLILGLVSSVTIIVAIWFVLFNKLERRKAKVAVQRIYRKLCVV